MWEGNQAKNYVIYLTCPFDGSGFDLNLKCVCVSMSQIKGKGKR